MSVKHISKLKRKEERWRILAECIRSDQLSARQIQEEFKIDPDFEKWYKKTYLKKKHK
jgi:hypothetical protein